MHWRLYTVQFAAYIGNSGQFAAYENSNKTELRLCYDLKRTFAHLFEAENATLSLFSNIPDRCLSDRWFPDRPFPDLIQLA